VGWLLKYHRLVVEGAEHLPGQGSALLLPKHRAYRDIIVEGVVLRAVTGRYATYVMKFGLFSILALVGGVKIVRPKDIRRLEDHRARRERIRWAREHNQATLDYLAWLYQAGEVVVSHPEGMRYQGAMGALQKEIVEHLLQAQQRWGLQVPLIPIGLEYESFVRPRSRVYVRIGEPLYSAQFAGLPSLMEALERRLRALSGFA